MSPVGVVPEIFLLSSIVKGVSPFMLHSVLLLESISKNHINPVSVFFII